MDSAKLEIATTGGASSVTLRIDSGVPLLVQGTSACGNGLHVPLYDDGTHGDRTAGDGTFTADGIQWHANAPANCTARTFTRTAPSLRGVYPGEITIVRRSGTATIPFNQYSLWVLPVSEFGVPEPVTRISPDVQVSAHVVNIADDQDAVNRILSAEQNASIQSLGSKVYSALPDVYDFLNFTTTSQRLCPGGKSLGLHVMVKQTWTGTGALPFDNTASYGSAGKLLGINVIEQQSSDYFPVFAHETLHQWAAYLPTSLGLAAAGGHWAENSNIAGAVGGGAWTANGDGTFSAASSGFSSRWRLSPLELYLMGLAPASEVPPILVSESAPVSFGMYGSRVTGPFRQVTVSQIQQAVGARVPGPESAQKFFRTAFVVTTAGRLLTQTEMTAYDRISRLFTGSLQPRPGNNKPTFTEISGGRASLETSALPCTFSLNLSDLTAPASGTGGTVAITAPGSYCKWSVSAEGSWIKINGGASGAGNGLISFSVMPNSGATTRSGSILVSGAVSLQRLPVVQPGQHESTPSAALMRNVGTGSDDAPVTRSQMAVYLIRALLGSDKFDFPAAPYFDDVPVGHPHFAWVQKLRETGITSGCGPRQFCPGSSVTRAEMAAFAVRTRLRITASQGFPFPSKPFFSDIPVTDPFFTYIQKMRELGITVGCSVTEFCPGSSTTRGQMALILMRAFTTP